MYIDPHFYCFISKINSFSPIGLPAWSRYQRLQRTSTLRLSACIPCWISSLPLSQSTVGRIPCPLRPVTSNQLASCYRYSRPMCFIILHILWSFFQWVFPVIIFFQQSRWFVCQSLDPHLFSAPSFNASNLCASSYFAWFHMFDLNLASFSFAHLVIQYFGDNIFRLLRHVHISDKI